MPAEAPHILRRESVASERTLADVRVILWLATAVVTFKLPGSPASSYRWLVIGLSIFLAYSLAMWLIVRYIPRWIRYAAAFSSVFEVWLITLIIWAGASPLTPFYLWYVFYVVSMSLRYGMQISILGLAASIVMYTLVAANPRDPFVYAPSFVGYTAFLFILAFLFGHMSERQRSYQTRLSVVNELGVALASLSTSREIIRLLVNETAELLRANMCWFAPSRNAEDFEFARVSTGVSSVKLSTLMASLGGWAPASILERGQTVVTNSPRKDKALTAEALKAAPLRSLAAVPLYVRDVPVGVLYVANKQPRGFSGYDIELLDLIAAQAAPLIENVQLWERLKESAASEERLRIARDLHDNFLQTLSAIKLYLERCRILLDKDTEKAKASIERLHEISTEGLADVRSYLSQLRLMGPDPSQFRQAVERSALEAAARCGFKVHTELDIAEDSLTPQISLAAFQVMRELLNNVVKHARALNVWISMKSNTGRLEIEVKDDGQGFDLVERRRASEKGHLGLVGIEERVKELAGEFMLQSDLGNGTTARIILPVRDENADE
jgi:signal transduction histidine kinase